VPETIGASNLRCRQASGLRWLAGIVLACLALVGPGLRSAAATAADSGASLRAKYVALGSQLDNNPFRRPLYLDSEETSRGVTGDIYALVDYPFADVSMALDSPAHWCDMLILHINTKYCRASTDRAGTVLAVSIGRKTYQPLDEAYRVEFAYRVAAASPDFLEIQLNAETGPLGTSNYRILLEATSVEGRRTFLHFTYSYAYGLAGRVAMEAYLATAGRDKVGFTAVGRQPNGLPDHIRGMRGLVERNTMRYYLAIDAYLGTLAAPFPRRLEESLQSWFAATERYPRQLHEVDRTVYLDMKRSEYLRQQTVQ